MSEKETMSNTISFVTANFVARELGYHMTGGWAQGTQATGDAFRPLETYAQRLDRLLQEIVDMGFQALDLWTEHLNPTWATDTHIAIAGDLLQKHKLTVTSLAGSFGATGEELERTCRLAVALDTPLLGGSTPLLHRARATLVALLRRYGLKFGLENHPEKSPQALLDKLGSGDEDVVGATVDTGWFGTQGYNAADALQELAPRLFHVHLKDVLAAGGHDTCRYGQGVVPLRACVVVLKNMEYRGAIAVEHEPEHFDPTDDVRACRDTLETWMAQ
jgi:sugar phosphate isomerase/epimerase